MLSIEDLDIENVKNPLHHFEFQCDEGSKAKIISGLDHHGTKIFIPMNKFEALRSYKIVEYDERDTVSDTKKLML